MKTKSLTWLGSSPRMRGAPEEDARTAIAEGIIPAYAGSTSDAPETVRDPGDHPRVCGEHPHFAIVTAGEAGSSPRMRGAHSRCSPTTSRHGIIPAYAGSTAGQNGQTITARDHPRVCGEHS